MSSGPPHAAAPSLYRCPSCRLRTVGKINKNPKAGVITEHNRTPTSLRRCVADLFLESRSHLTMPWLVSQLRQHLCRRSGTGIAGGSRRQPFSKASGSDEISIEEDTERKVGYLLKIIFAGTAGVVAYQFFPYMGDNLLHQSVSLLQVKDPLFKRMGASRLSRFAIDDERRMRVVEIGGAQGLVSMLESAKDDRTRKAALKALVALSHSEEAVGVLHQSGALPIIKATPNSSEFVEIEKYRSELFKRFEDLQRNTTLQGDILND